MPIAVISTIFGFVYFNEPVKEVHYEIGISGIKEQYVIGEQLKFSIFLNGYGSPCGDYKIKILKGDQFIDGGGVDMLCVGPPEEKFMDLEFYMPERTTFKLVLNETGSYTVTAEFWRIDYGKITTQKNFDVIAN